MVPVKGGEKTVQSIHVMVCGQKSGGKTTLIRHLLGEEVNMSQTHGTEGIHVDLCDVSLSTGAWTRQPKDLQYSTEQDIGQHLSSATNQQEESTSAVLQRKPTQSEANKKAMIKLSKEYLLLALWDFPGQYTHQTFLTKRAIYLLVFDVSVESKATLPNKVYELLEVCLNSIHSCASSQDDSPSLILVGTHVDKLSQCKIQEDCKICFSEIRSYLKDKPTRVHLIDEDFAIDNTVVGRRLEDLKRKIIQVASQQSYWGKKIPARWLLLEQELMRHKANGVKVISHEDVNKINMECTVQIKTDELDQFLTFLHQSGTIIYDSIGKSRENIILDQTLITDAMNSIINAQTDMAEIFNVNIIDSSISTDNFITKKWSDFKEKGILSPELIDAVWTKEKYPELHAHKDLMLLEMEQHNIIAKPKAFNENGVKIEDFFLTPSMLRQESPRDIIFPKQDPLIVSTPALCCVFIVKVLPPPIFHRLIAACVSHWPVAKNKETSENLIFNNCCIFNLDLFHRLILHSENHIVFARITRLVDDDVRIPEPKLCTRVRKFITLNLSKIISEVDQNLKYKLCSWSSPSQILTEDGNAAPFDMWFVDEGHDPDSPITREHMNHARLGVALATVCGNAMRDVLRTKVPPENTDIYEAILDNELNLTFPEGRPILNPDQIALVFPDPAGKKTGNVDQFDISLLYILIRNISSVPAPVTDWGNEPDDQPWDNSLGASMERIRIYRNQIGHSTDGKIAQHDFDDYWKKIDAVLDDIEHALPTEGYRAQLEKQKKQVISVYEAC